MVVIWIRCAGNLDRFVRGVAMAVSIVRIGGVVIGSIGYFSHPNTTQIDLARAAAEGADVVRRASSNVHVPVSAYNHLVGVARIIVRTTGPGVKNDVVLDDSALGAPHGQGLESRAQKE